MDKRSYIIRKIRKKKGGFRIISEPRSKLKLEQKAILKWLMARGVAPSQYSHAFIKKRSIVTNAKVHIGKKVVVKVDIENFFGSVTKDMVIFALTKENLNEDDAQKIAEICTLDGYLPQGAASSPILSNLVLKWKLDYRLAGLAQSWAEGKYNTVYTRYCDDLIISSDDGRLNMILPIVEKFVNEAGFTINKSKTRVFRNSNRQIVTGVVVNKTPNIRREERRLFRAKLHHIKMSLLNGKRTRFNLSKLQGKAAFIKGVNPAIGKGFVQKVEEIKSLVALKSRLSLGS